MTKYSPKLSRKIMPTEYWINFFIQQKEKVSIAQRTSENRTFEYWNRLKPDIFVSGY
jgi:hypothetical protein